MSILKKIPTILGAGGESVPEWRKHLQPCEYLQTDGNSWILIDNVNGADFGIIKTKFKGPDPFGYRNQTSGGYFLQIYGSTNNTLVIRWFVGSSTNISLGNVADIVNILELYPTNPRSLIINGTIIAYNYNANYFTQAFALLGLYNPNNIINCSNGTRLYYFNSNLFNLIACYAIDEYIDNKGNVCPSDTPGMVDTLTGIFYTNDGPGQFTHGGDI